MKATLIAIAALLVVDAVAWHGQFRYLLLHEARDGWRYVTSQSWSGTLTQQ